MIAFVIAAVAMLAALVPAGVIMARGALADAGVGYEFITTVVVLVLVLVVDGFGRSGLFELPVLLAILLYGSGLVFVRALERWL